MGTPFKILSRAAEGVWDIFDRAALSTSVALKEKFGELTTVQQCTELFELRYRLLDLNQPMRFSKFSKFSKFRGNRHPQDIISLFRTYENVSRGLENTIKAGQSLTDIRDEIREVLRRNVLAATPAPPFPFQKTVDGMPVTEFNPQALSAPIIDWSVAAASIRSTQGAIAVFTSSDEMRCPPNADMDTAPRRSMWGEKIQFLSRLLAERSLLEMQARNEFNSLSHMFLSVMNGGEFNSPSRRLLEVMDGIVDLVLKTPVYEVDACPKNGIPAFFMEEGPEAGIYFSKGSYNFNLLFHEMGHRFQMSNVKRGFISHSSGDYCAFDARNVNNEAKYLWREEEVYQWNVDYILFKAGYDDMRRYELEEALRQIKRLESGPMLMVDCKLLAGRLPQAYEQVLQLMQRIQRIPDFSEEEILSAQALATAYFNIDIDPEGLIRIQENRLPEMLGQFYHEHLSSGD